MHPTQDTIDMAADRMFDLISIEQARDACRQYNDNNKPGKYSRKAEFTSI